MPVFCKNALFHHWVCVCRALKVEKKSKPCSAIRDTTGARYKVHCKCFLCRADDDDFSQGCVKGENILEILLRSLSVLLRNVQSGPHGLVLESVHM